ncbi:hypothetical protein AYL99_11364 [Fonsecaea erecta]|uniref:Endopolyphosphatase n=1 Tax=Fonsecaea erecta TaxID=1367422 RepID=A0A178Z504_9EURO|nr:hypothetical protein AYL99_11364 [Fonsecaea erecta]OAP54263.1 hypothetical protein AYL99_11364 [Fonsecaea erecta]
MVRLARCLWLFAALVAAAPPNIPWKDDASQQVVGRPSTPKSQPAPRKLRGRFLHITDIHPDPFYKPHSDPEQNCHSGHGSAGYYGAEVTDCDTPISLVNATFRWIEANLKDEIDFVVWTGDSARHDNDERQPRSDKQVLKLNQFIVDKFVEAFGKPDNKDDPDPTNDFVVPIVPTFGNNDILPHNIFTSGPNKWTRSYLDVWDRFIPQAQRHSFARGGWFFTEVIPNRLAVFSLNTLYFFESNSAVDGCNPKSEPGYEHMEWLRIQLQFLRDRGMKAILIGHVPPARTESKQNWDESCYHKFTLWMRQYRDVIVTSIFGHMNIDHFMFQDVKDLPYKFNIKGVDDGPSKIERLESSPNDTFSIAAKAQYLNELRSGWSALPKPPAGHSYLSLDDADIPGDTVDAGKKNELAKFLEAIGGPWAERYSMSLVSPSVVPNFFPTLRVIEYNITGLENEHPAEGAIGEPAAEHHMNGSADLEVISEEAGEDESGADVESEDDVHDLKKKKKGKKKKKKKKKKGPQKPKFPVPKPPSKSSPPGPAYSPQSLSLLSFTQYYANLTRVHELMHADKSSKKDRYKHFHYSLEYTTNNDSAYRMEELTVRSMLDLAEKMGRDSLNLSDTDTEHVEKDADSSKKGGDNKTKRRKNHLWKVFIKRAFVHTKPDDEIDQQFG